jgi:hypothetical protein
MKSAVGDLEIPGVSAVPWLLDGLADQLRERSPREGAAPSGQAR